MQFFDLCFVRSFKNFCCKRGTKINLSNYAPVSIQPLVSKMTSMIKLLFFVTENNILYENQSSLLSKHYSIIICLLFLSDKILSELYSGLLTGQLLFIYIIDFDHKNVWIFGVNWNAWVSQ